MTRKYVTVETLALVLNGFAFLVVNGMIYWALWAFRLRTPDFTRPPTISEAIADPKLGEPFGLWIGVAAVALSVGVLCLVLRHIRMQRQVTAPGRFLCLMFWLGVPALVGLQVIASLGIHWTSAYRLPHFRDMHMLGSYLFFGFQAAVIFVYVIYNYALFADRASLDSLVRGRWISARWVKLRMGLGLWCVGITATYGAFFILKDGVDYAQVKWVRHVYVTLEPMVISSFLVMLMSAHADLFRRPRDAKDPSPAETAAPQ